MVSGVTGGDGVVVSLFGTTEQFELSSDRIDVAGLGGASPQALDDGQPHIVVVKWDVLTSDLFAKVDDDTSFTLLDDSSASPVIEENLGLAIGDLQVSLRGFADGDQSGGDFGELLVYPKVLTDADVNRLGNYFRDKWGANWLDLE